MTSVLSSSLPISERFPSKGISCRMATERPCLSNRIRTFKADMVLSDIGRFVSTIASMPELTHVTVGCFTSRHAGDRPLEVLSHLTSLTLLMHDYSYNNLQAIIKPLSLPNLSSLSLVHEKSGSTGCFFKFAHLEHLLQSCANSLRSIHFPGTFLLKRRS